MSGILMYKPSFEPPIVSTFNNISEKTEKDSFNSNDEEDYDSVKEEINLNLLKRKKLNLF